MKITSKRMFELRTSIDITQARLAKELGISAKKHITGMDITWDNVVKELTK